MGIPVNELRFRQTGERNDLRLEAVAPFHEEIAIIRIEAVGVGQTSSCVTDRIPERQAESWQVECMELA